ncbi:hypothetical protein [Sulfurirhabdus autotrophica]|uniref:hypothetical protein n=1 Tax=Sulfurirhabdus autotrophica TaxID=1706046 RepID=UPI00140444E1|nr:hypothetical protein [Sulfurirhabdus autotrophica]
MREINLAIKAIRDWLRQLLVRMRMPVSQNKALRLASQIITNKVRNVPLICYGTQPSNCRIYNRPSEPCWYIYAPWNDHHDVLAVRSSRVILVGKKTGAILYDGSAGNEG